jgi:hypothetical protein
VLYQGEEFLAPKIIHSLHFFLTFENIFSMVGFKEAKDRTILPFDAHEPYLSKDCDSFTARSSQLSFA